MSNIRPRKIRPQTLSEQKTLPIQSPDARAPKTRAPIQSDRNVRRAKRWGEEHQC